MKKNFVFDNVDGNIEFIGDFEGLYKSEEDPWNQSGSDSNLQKHYESSRNNLLYAIKNLSNNRKICEIGCGLGFVADFLHVNLPNSFVDGVDISQTAIKKAKESFLDLDFYVGDICSQNFPKEKKYNVVILNQILWYILKDLKNVFDNIDKILQKDGYLIISTLFLKNQRYGNEIIGSFDDLINYCYTNQKKRFIFIYGNIKYQDKSTEHQDSILVLQKI